MDAGPSAYEIVTEWMVRGYDCSSCDSCCKYGVLSVPTEPGLVEWIKGSLISATDDPLLVYTKCAMAGCKASMRTRLEWVAILT